MEEIVNALAETGAPMIMVTNEVGSGVVPMTLLGRWFQDLLGKVNQFLAKEAETVYFVVCGIPQKIK
ncbi:bifunctional adenosylcobinamide kinase/adenosylcobinamide-phosphate guanylyltransferase [Enterococcus rivorum]|uniref:bifunctional adenosylcobinamide kinase/adenosylcobinamide-phosphate guanylyltransferase n=1 Tax=Enterococcus rivorum TaxID=762845 RepID=UPI003637D493